MLGLVGKITQKIILQRFPEDGYLRLNVEHIDKICEALKCKNKKINNEQGI